MNEFAIELGKIIFIFFIVVGFFTPILTWVERKQSAIMQDRIGANRASIMGFTLFGLFHPIADAVKMITKEDVMPAGANKVMHAIAPMISVISALVLFAVVPFGGEYTIFGYPIKLVIADLDAGLLFIFAIASLATYGTVLAGWSSNNNWSLLGAIRASSQMFSYEIAMGLTIMGIFMIYGTLNMQELVYMQGDFLRWGIFLQPVSFFLFITAAIAETKRAPFDLPESESELVAGYFTEYSGMKFGMFYMSEFIGIVTLSGVITTLFFGGWNIPFLSKDEIISSIAFMGEDMANLLTMIIHIAVFFLKVIFFIWLQMTIRWTLPRFRYDQLMRLGWKMLLPISLCNIFITAIGILLFN